VFFAEGFEGGGGEGVFLAADSLDFGDEGVGVAVDFGRVSAIATANA
jgi:hypothetical protein